MNVPQVGDQDKHSQIINSIYIGLAFLIICGLVAPLFMVRPFYLDWINHVWAVNYFRHVLLKDGDFPLFINSLGAAGNPAPIFYGYLFYPILSLLACLLGADLSIRLMAGAVLIAHYGVYYRIARLSFPSPLAVAIGALSAASVYEMTNLYNRSALTEFFSYELLSIAIPLFFLSMWSGSRIKTGLFISSLGLMTGAVGMHPPTAYATAIFVAPSLIIIAARLIKTNRPRLNLVHGFAIITACCVIAPWIYFVIRYASLLAISNQEIPGVYYFTTSIDSWMGKLLPFYVDRRVLADGIAPISTPFLNASLQLPMLLVILGLAAITWRRSSRAYRVGFTVMMVCCLVAIFLSCPPPHQFLTALSNRYWFIVPNGNFFLYDLIAPLQFAYRLTNIVSLQLSVLLLFVVLELVRHGAQKLSSLSIALPLLLVVALAGICLQDQAILSEFAFYSPSSGSVDLGPDAKRNDQVLGYSWSSYLHQIEDIDHYPDTFYSQGNYAMPGIVRPRNFDGDPTPWVLANFVETQPMPSITVNCATPCLVQTNLLPSIFVRPTLNDIQVPQDAVVSISSRLAFMAPAGINKVGFVSVSRALIFFRIARWIGILWVFGAGAYIAAFVFFRGRWSSSLFSRS